MSSSSARCLDRLLGLGELVGQPLQLVLALAKLGRAARRPWPPARTATWFLLVALGREPLQLLAVAVDLDDLRGSLVAEGLDAHFEPPGRHGELGAHAVLVGLDVGERQRHRGLDALARQRHGAPPDRRRDHQREEAGAQKAEGEEEDGLDHASIRSTTRAAEPYLPRRGSESSAAACDRVTADASAACHQARA